MAADRQARATRPMAATSYLEKFPWSSMSRKSGSRFSELRITQAYIKLLCTPENADGAKLVSLEWIGACEIRMFEGPAAATDDAPLFWIELFDHDGQSSVDGCSCYDIAQAAAEFDRFLLQAKRLAEFPPQQDGETPA